MVVFEVDDAVGVLAQRQRVGGDRGAVGTVAPTTSGETSSPRPAPTRGVDDDDRVQALEPGKDAGQRSRQIAIRAPVRSSSRCATTSVSVSEWKTCPRTGARRGGRESSR